MRKPILHQYIAGAAPGDAITDCALLLRRWLREAGYRSEIFAESIHPAMEKEVRPYLTYHPAGPGEMLILHHSIGSEGVNALLTMDIRFLMVYHNVSPPAFFSKIDPELAKQLRIGREQLHALRERTVLALGVSAYNERELRDLGYGATDVLPIVLDLTRYDFDPNPALLARYRTPAPNLLFVGRLVPNKRIEDLIKLLYYYRRVVSNARLFLVGTPWMPAYTDWLHELTNELALQEAVIFAGHVPQRDLVTYYHLADLYVSMSEHEGFGKPFIESMHMDLPVLAYAAAAVPETLGGAGVLVRYKDFEAIAELIQILLQDNALRARVLARQRQRVRDFLEPQVRQKWQEITLFLREGP